MLVYRSEQDSAPVSLDLGKTAANKLFVRGAASWMNRNLSANLCNAIGARKAMGLLGLAEGHRVKLKRHPHHRHGPDAFVVQLDGEPAPLPEAAEKKPAGVPGQPASSEKDAPRRKRGRPPKLADGATPDTPREPAAKKEVSARMGPSSSCTCISSVRSSPALTCWGPAPLACARRGPPAIQF